MKLLLFVTLVALCITSCRGRVVCFLNSSFSGQTALGPFNITFIERALPKCTHLIYGNTGITTNGEEVNLLDMNFDSNFKYLIKTRLKLQMPEIKIVLSIGGNADPDKETHKYLKVVATQDARQKFINSILQLLSDYDFDGIDLAWQFPTINEHILVEAYETLGGTQNIYKIFRDNNETEHREGFSALVKDLNTELRARKKSLTLTVLPHVNTTVYYDVKALAPNVAAVHLMALDLHTPERNPTKASYPAPVYRVPGRNKRNNVDFIVRDWLDRGMPNTKIVLGIPTFGRTWKLKRRVKKNKHFNVSNLLVHGPGAKGPISLTRGLLSYTEICLLLNPDLPRISGLKQIRELSKKNGASAYSYYNQTTRSNSIWTGYDDPGTALYKVEYAVSKGLRNIAIFDLINDDYRGLCRGVQFPILNAVYMYF